MLDYNYENEPLIKIEDLVVDNTTKQSITSKKYNNTIDFCFNKNYKNKAQLTKKYMEESREVLERYEANNFALLKQKIINSRKICYNRKEIEKHINTLDFQINLIKSCSSHAEFIKKNYDLNLSNDKLERREYNLDIYFDIVDYFVENILEEQKEYYV